MTGKILVVPCLLTFSLFFSIGMTSGEYPVEKPSLSLGHEIFDSNCAGCHGEKGDGSAIKGAFNFTNDELMITKNSSLFFNVVTNGVSGTGMPSFGKLSASQRWDVVAYLWIFWMDNASVEHGRNIYQENCTSCHGANGDSSGRAFDFTNVSMMVSKEPELLFKNVSDGVKGTSMPPWKDSLSESERWDTVKYIWTFQFKDYSQMGQPPMETPSAKISSSSESWYFTPVGMGILAISIILGIAVLYLFGKGMQER